MEPAARWTIVKEKKLCFCCLGRGHMSSNCRRPFLCKEQNCTGRHHWLLHREREKTQKNHERSSERSEKSEKIERTQKTDQCTLLAKDNNLIALRTVPIILVNKNRRVRINALLDDASTRTYLNADVAAELGLQGDIEMMRVRTLNGAINTFQTAPVTVDIQSLDGEYSVQVQAFTTEKVTGNLEAVDWSKLSKQWNYLQKITFSSIKGRQTIDMLIGLDNADLHFACREVGGHPGEPTARLTPIGWTCVGQVEKEISIQQTLFCHECSDDMKDIITKFWTVEEVPERGKAAERSVHEQTAEAMVAKSLKWKDHRYQVAMPWKVNPRELPDNSQTATQRLISTERRLQKEPELSAAYQAVLDDHLEKNYIRRVNTDTEETSSQWLLPHFAVVRRDRDTTKIRIVFDASARHQGICLNDCIHTGPKLQNDLLQVLLRFRRHPVALVCDIEAMYLRIELAPEDRRYCRLRDLDITKSPEVYEFNSVVFGVNCSPFLAQYVAQENENAMSKSSLKLWRQ
jgi:hypothetical protein